MSLLNDFINNKEEGEKKEKLAKELVYQQLDPETRKNWQKVLQKQYGITRETEVKPSASRFSLKWGLALAASVALLIITYFALNQRADTPQQLAQTYIQKLSIIADQSVFRKGDSDIDQLRSQANEAYIKKDFNTAETLWKQLIAQQKANTYDQFYLGLTYLQKEATQPQKTIELLTSIQEKAPELRQEINWVLSLAYIQVGQEERARAILQGIVDKEAFMAAPSKELLELLDRQ